VGGTRILAGGREDAPRDGPAHRAACDYIGREVFLRRDSCCGHYTGQAVHSYADQAALCEQQQATNK
jgi:hypothetical protein